MFALGLRQFAQSENKSNLANEIALTFRQLAKLGFFDGKSSSEGQTIMYMVSLERSLKMQENDVCFMLIS